MSIQHAEVTDPNIHEPKGISTALADTVYVADGAGSGSYQPLPKLAISNYEILLSSESVTAAQNPAGLDTDLQVDFGPAVGGPTDPVQMDGTGLVTINETGVYHVRVDAHFGRTGAAGIAFLNSRFLFNGVQITPTYTAHLDNADVILPYASYFVAHLDAGDTIVLQINRDPAGNDSGGLLEPPVTSTGWSNSFSARIAIGRQIDG